MVQSFRGSSWTEKKHHHVHPLSLSFLSLTLFCAEISDDDILWISWYRTCSWSALPSLPWSVAHYWSDGDWWHRLYRIPRFGGLTDTFNTRKGLQLYIIIICYSEQSCRQRLKPQAKKSYLHTYMYWPACRNECWKANMVIINHLTNQHSATSWHLWGSIPCSDTNNRIIAGLSAKKNTHIKSISAVIYWNGMLLWRSDWVWDMCHHYHYLSVAAAAGDCMHLMGWAMVWERRDWVNEPRKISD